MTRISCFLTLCLFLSLGGCGVDDFNKKIGNKYIFMFEGGGYNKIGKETKRNSHSISYDLVIPHAVIDYAHNDTYILAVQVSNCASILNSKTQDTCLRNEVNHNYWIINAKVDKIHGPMTRQKYIDLKADLGVPSELNVGDGDWELLQEW